MTLRNLVVFGALIVVAVGMLVLRRDAPPITPEAGGAATVAPPAPAPAGREEEDLMSAGGAAGTALDDAEALPNDEGARGTRTVRLRSLDFLNEKLAESEAVVEERLEAERLRREEAEMGFVAEPGE